ncbi:MAG: cell division ATP-binding protein FtsE [Mycoplasmatales bacterium]
MKTDDEKKIVESNELKEYSERRSAADHLRTVELKQQTDLLKDQKDLTENSNREETVIISEFSFQDVEFPTDELEESETDKKINEIFTQELNLNRDSVRHVRDLSKRIERTIDTNIQGNKKETFKEFDYTKEAKAETVTNEMLENIYAVAQNEEQIRFTDVELKIENDTILKNINLTINKGEFVYFVGSSGAGKSSIIKLLYRELKNTTGTVTLDGENITKFPRRKLPYLRRRIGVIFQDFRLLPDKNVFENVRFALEIIGYPRKKRKEQVNKILKQVGIYELSNKYPNELSGGQQQFVAIARAIVAEPKLILADEPTGNLDPESAVAIMKLMKEINLNGTTVIMATHDVGIVNMFKHRVVLIKKGAIKNEVKGEYIYE